MLFLPLERVPIYQHFGAVGDAHIPKDMGMAEDELFADAVGHGLQVEPSGFPLDVGVEDHLEKHVPQFFLQMLGVLLIDGLDDLAALLQQSPAEALVGLLSIPGAAARGTEDGDDVFQVFETIGFFPNKIYHILPSSARVFSQKVLEITEFFALVSIIPKVMSPCFQNLTEYEAIWQFYPPWA